MTDRVIYAICGLVMAVCGFVLLTLGHWIVGAFAMLVSVGAVWEANREG